MRSVSKGYRTLSHGVTWPGLLLTDAGREKLDAPTKDGTRAGAALGSAVDAVVKRAGQVNVVMALLRSLGLA